MSVQDDDKATVGRWFELDRLPSYADLGETWLRDQKARILQRHLQFGRRFRIDVDSLLSRTASLIRLGVPHRLPREDFMRRATVDAIEHCLHLDAATSTADLQPNVGMSRAPRLNSRSIPGPAPLGAFVRGGELGGDSRGEWLASVTQQTDVVVGDADGAPSPIGIAKALSILQSRAYLERRAVQLLVPLTKEPGNWRLVKLDFGARARHHECEFLMCFAFEATDSELTITSPYAEIGFALMAPAPDDPLFILTVKTAVGFSR